MKTTLCWAVVLTLFSAISYLALTTPVVQFTHLTHQCVSVIPPEAGTCTNLPKRYETEIVAPI